VDPPFLFERRDLMAKKKKAAKKKKEETTSLGCCR
jgi:hypothetical protein